VLEAVRWRRNGAPAYRPIRHVFNFIGPDPNSNWLASCGLVLDRKGLITTAGGSRGPLETSEPGVFAIGDVRSGSTKRVAAAVGEGAQAVAALHAYLEDAGA
jgi:thioredoxin reductase (NADPH)